MTTGVRTIASQRLLAAFYQHDPGLVGGVVAGDFAEHRLFGHFVVHSQLGLPLRSG